MLYISTDKEFWLLQCSDFEPKKQRFSWKKLGKEEALVLAKKARDIQVEKRRYNAQLEKQRELAEEAAEEAWRIERNKAIDEREAKREEEDRKQRAQRALEERSAVYKIKLPDDLDDDRKRLINRDLFYKDLQYYHMTLEQLENALPSLINHYEVIRSWDRVWLGLKT
jgi:predicted transposase YbfD/YdcC